MQLRHHLIFLSLRSKRKLQCEVTSDSLSLEISTSEHFSLEISTSHYFSLEISISDHFSLEISIPEYKSLLLTFSSRNHYI